MSKYLAFATSAFSAHLAYRSEVWAGLFGALVLVLVKIAIWKAVYGGGGSVAGISLQDMITYAVLGGLLVNIWDYADPIYRIGETIRSGEVAVYLLKPLRYPLYLFANECGNMSYSMLTRAAPVIVIIALTYGVLPPASLFHAVFFVLYWLIAFVMLFLMAAMCGLLAFWLMTAFSLDWFLRAFLSLLSGTLVPLWFYPEWLADIARRLPFAYVGYYPSAVYLGKMGTGETLAYCFLGLFWVAVFMAAVAWLWRRATLRLSIQGG